MLAIERRYRLVLAGLLGLAVLGSGCKRGETDEATGGAGGGFTSGGEGGTAGSGGTGGSGDFDVLWHPLASGTTTDLHDVWLNDDGGVIAVGATGTILRETASGFESVESGVSATLRGVFGPGDGHVFVVGELGTILHSTDGGVSFLPVASGTTVDLYDVWGSDPSTLFATGTSSTILRSTDGGVTWEPRPNAAINPISAVWGTSAEHIIAVSDGSFLQSTDGGASFDLSFISLNAHNDVWAATPVDYFSVNDGGIITSWEGDHWLKVIISPKRHLEGMWGSGLDDMYVVGELGTILHSDDAGDDWIWEDSGSSEFLRGVFGANGRVIAVGEGGTVLEREAP